MCLGRGVIVGEPRSPAVLRVNRIGRLQGQGRKLAPGKGKDILPFYPGYNAESEPVGGGAGGRKKKPPPNKIMNGLIPQKSVRLVGGEGPEGLLTSSKVRATAPRKQGLTMPSFPPRESAPLLAWSPGALARPGPHPCRSLSLKSHRCFLRGKPGPV